MILCYGSLPPFVLFYGWPTCESMNTKNKEFEPIPWIFNPLENDIQEAQLLVYNLTSHFIILVIIGWMVTDHTGCDCFIFWSFPSTVYRISYIVTYI